MAKLYCVNIHNRAGTMIGSLAFKNETSATDMLSSMLENQQDGTFKFADDYGHTLVIDREAIGYMIYVDEAKDAELAKIVSTKALQAQIDQQARERLVRA